MEENKNENKTLGQIETGVSLRKVLILTTTADYTELLVDTYEKIIERLYDESNKLENAGIMKIDEHWEIDTNYRGHIDFSFATKEGGYACSLVVCDGVATNVRAIAG